MSVEFKFDSKRTAAAIGYLVSKKLPDLTKYKICKLLFFADKLHLVRYGRTITGDDYFALDWGPIPSTTLDGLNDQHPFALRLQALLMRKHGGGRHPTYSLRSDATVDMRYLSKSDQKVLNNITEAYGQKSFDDLYDLTHLTPAYIRAWARKKEHERRSAMRFEEFFEDDENAVPGAREEMLENASLLEDSHG
jgi:uncharacterized phage-associated protein